MIGLVNANLAVSIMEDNDTLLSYQNIIKKEISLPYKEREIYIVYDPLNISKLSLDIIQEMLNFKILIYISVFIIIYAIMCLKLKNIKKI